MILNELQRKLIRDLFIEQLLTNLAEKSLLNKRANFLVERIVNIEQPEQMDKFLLDVIGDKLDLNKLHAFLITTVPAGYEIIAANTFKDQFFADYIKQLARLDDEELEPAYLEFSFDIRLRVAKISFPLDRDAEQTDSDCFSKSDAQPAPHSSSRHFSKM